MCGMSTDPFGVPDASSLPTAPAFGDTPTKKKRKKWPWIVGGVVVILALLAVVGLVFGRKGSANPRDAVSKFWTQVKAHDLKKANDYVCQNKHVKTDDANFRKLTNAVTAFSIGAETGSGGKLIYPVTLTLTVGGQTEPLVVPTTAVKTAGQWYVCGLDGK
jgi:hypothetical protein